MDKGEGGGRKYHNFPSKVFMSHSAEKFRKGILLFLRKFLISKSFMDEKGVSQFSVENFLSQCRKTASTGIFFAQLQIF